MMKNTYTIEQLKDALHQASMTRIGLNISSFFLGNIHWSKAEVQDLMAILDALPEVVQEQWNHCVSRDLVEHDQYKITYGMWETTDTVDISQTILETGTTGKPRQLQTHSIATEHPSTGRKMSFRDVDIHPRFSLYKKTVLPAAAEDDHADSDVYHLSTALRIRPEILASHIERGELPVEYEGERLMLNVADVRDYVAARKRGNAVIQDAIRAPESKQGQSLSQHERDELYNL